MQQGSMSLELVFKFIILLVVIGVVIGLIINFQEGIGPDVITPSNGDQSQECDTEIKQGDFSSNEVAKWIKSCWSQHKGGLKDCVCYSLQGSFSATESAVKQSITSSAKNQTVIEADFSQAHVVNIIYNLEKGKIMVKSGG